MVPKRADWLSPATLAITATGPATPVAVKVAGLPERLPAAVAVNVFVPAMLPSVHPPTVAGPSAPVAVNVTGLPSAPATDAVSELFPATLPSVQPPTRATPSEPVVVEPPVVEPPPAVTANVTAMPTAGDPLLVTFTLGFVA